MDTVPGVARAIATGLNMKVEPYADGDAGIRKSLEEMARIMREARHDTALMGWAIDALKAKGLDGRNRPGPGIKAQAEVLLNALREKTIYKPDPSGSEWIQAPHVTLCLRDLCIPAEDCDGLTTCLGGAMLSIGLPAYIVKQNFGPNHQQHVLVGIIDEKGKKWYADPSTNRPLTSASNAVEEIWLDPLDQVGHTGVSGAEIVTLGKPGEHCCSSCEAGGECNGLAQVKAEPCCQSCAEGRGCEGTGATKSRETFFKDGRWFEYSNGHWLVFDRGSWWRIVGNGTLIHAGVAGISGLGAPIGFTAIDISQSRKITEGLRYKFEVEFNYKGDPSSYDYLPAMAREEIEKSFFIESLTPKGPAARQNVSGSWLDRLGKWFTGEELWVQRVEFVGISKKTGDFNDDPDARVPYRLMSLSAQAASPLNPVVAEKRTNVGPLNGSNFGLGNTLIAAVGIGSLAGIAYFMLKSKGK